jgi:3-oxoacyl-[acyl-carrier protein] reductase
MYTSDLMKTLENKIALVTGSSRGMGKEIALRLSDHIAGVVIHYRRNRDAAMSVVEEIRAKGKSSVCFRADLTKQKEAQLLIQKSRERIADIDILVNNFGPILVKPWEDLDPEDWDHILDSNLESAFY